MLSIETSLCAAAKIVAKPVRFRKSGGSNGMPACMFATQRLEFTLHDGNHYTLVIHLEEGCHTLTASEPVVLPPVPESDGEPA